MRVLPGIHRVPAVSPFESLSSGRFPCATSAAAPFSDAPLFSVGRLCTRAGSCSRPFVLSSAPPFLTVSFLVSCFFCFFRLCSWVSPFFFSLLSGGRSLVVAVLSCRCGPGAGGRERALPLRMQACRLRTLLLLSSLFCCSCISLSLGIYIF